MSRRKVRSVYLITYSRAQPERIESRDSFAVKVLDSFENANPNTTSKVLQWVCSEEKHQDGGIHYHMAVKLDRSRRWLKVRNYADKTHGVKLNFSSSHANYYSAWKYTTKEDTQYLESEGHPDLKKHHKHERQVRFATTSARKREGKIRSVGERSVYRCMKSRKWQWRKV